MVTMLRYAALWLYMMVVFTTGGRRRECNLMSFNTSNWVCAKQDTRLPLDFEKGAMVTTVAAMIEISIALMIHKVISIVDLGRMETYKVNSRIHQSIHLFMKLSWWTRYQSQL
jgi:hypothetical protein